MPRNHEPAEYQRELDEIIAGVGVEPAQNRLDEADYPYQ